MNFITNLPASAGKTVIWVVVDRLSKTTHFVGLPSKFNAVSLATVFSTEIFRLHGMPKTIVSDRDKLFLSYFWRELFKLSGTTLAMSSAYHPQSDGQTEVLNRVLETYLQCFVSEEPRGWLRFLHLAEYWYNTSYHSSLRMSQFQALYGRALPSMVDYLADDSSGTGVGDLLREKRESLAAARYHLSRARQRMKSQADKHRQDCHFTMGDWVLLRLQSYCQHSIHRWTSEKLSRRFYGPFRIVHRIGPVAYELDLPDSSQIHPVFHISS
ncbi:UNVERIFIED_CONTAM: Transposon Ty3-I Gag-Pol polyprotein [Sesamum radiatum]|uniref:Transposon Ty3-I Gag-Pol polyprotein n=1 Tax=Sesamum radiatum TaxID=300843 RepID=A0AAW2PMJ9_SESRA